MRKYFSFLALLIVAATSFAQTSNLDADPDTSRALIVEREHNRIEAERAQEEARYQTQEAVCYTRFAVTDCIRQARLHRRDVLERLRRQEVTLNDAERKRKALAQIEQIKEKSSAQQVEEEAAHRLEASRAQKERDERAAQKAAAAMSAASAPGQGSAVAKPAEQGRTPDDIAKDQKQYQDKLKEVQEHRADRLKSNREKTGAPTKSLPLPP